MTTTTRQLLTLAVSCIVFCLGVYVGVLFKALPIAPDIANLLYVFPLIVLLVALLIAKERKRSLR